MHSFLVPEYKCLTANLSVASWVPQQQRIGTYAFDCRYNYENRPIFYQVEGNKYLSFHETNAWLVGSDPARYTGGIRFKSPDANYVPFNFRSVSTYYWKSQGWHYVSREVIHLNCIEDNNY